MVFEAVGTRDRNSWTLSGEHTLFEALIRVADVFWHQWEQDLTHRAIRAPTTEEIEKKVKCRLAAGCDRDVFGTDLPAVFLAKKTSEIFNHPSVAARRIVDSQRAAKSGGLVENVAQTLTPDLLHFWNVSGIAPAEHEWRRTGARESIAEIIHEELDATATRQALT